MSDSTDDSSHSTTRDADGQFNLEYWRQQSQESKALITRLRARLRGRDRRIERLELAIARTAVMHHVWASRLERRLEQSSAAGVEGQTHISHSISAQVEGAGDVIVHLPHLTRTLEALFEVMREFWSEWDSNRPPKSSTVARAIDEKLGLKAQANGEASRSAQTFAAALRPDLVSESDGRHR